jgi:hypothetical protein
MPPVKVLWVTERFPPDRGGAAASAARQVAGLAPRLERLDLLCLSGSLPPGRVSLQEQGALRVHRVGRAPGEDESLQLLAQTAQNLLDAHRHDLVHGFYAVHAGYVAVMAARQAGVRSLVSLRGNDLDRVMFHGPPPVPPVVSATPTRRPSYPTRCAGRCGPATADRVQLVPNGVDAEPSGPTARSTIFPAPPPVAGLGEPA